jgi:hypothetical protein
MYRGGLRKRRHQPENIDEIDPQQPNPSSAGTAENPTALVRISTLCCARETVRAPP